MIPSATHSSVGLRWRTLSTEFEDEEYKFQVPERDLSRVSLSLSLWSQEYGKESSEYIGKEGSFKGQWGVRSISVCCCCCFD